MTQTYIIFAAKAEHPLEISSPDQNPDLYERGDMLYHIESDSWLRHNGALWGSAHLTTPTKEQRAWVLMMRT